MTRDEYIHSVLSQIEDKSARAEIEAELNAHLMDRIEYYTNAGFSFPEAEATAIGNMGNRHDIGVMFDQLYNKTVSNSVLMIFTIAYALLMLAGVVLIMDSDKPLVICGFNICLICVPLCFILFSTASRLYNSRCFQIVSTANLIGLFPYLFTHNIDYWVMDIVKQNIFVKGAVTKGAYFAALVYFFLSAVIGFLCAANIRTIALQKVKTTVLKRYYRSNIIGAAASLLILSYYVYYIVKLIERAGLI